MAQEAKRGCGYRKVGALYLVNDGKMFASCDRLPFPLNCCPVCDAGFKPFRGVKKINPVALFGSHEVCTDDRLCLMCDGTLPNRQLLLDEEGGVIDVGDYLMCVGERFYPKAGDFLAESLNMGVSKRISTIPNNLIVGHSWVFLAHPTAYQKTIQPDE